MSKGHIPKHPLSPSIKRGRPSYKSLDIKHNKYSPSTKPNQSQAWVNFQLDNLNPGEHFIIPHTSTLTLNLKSLRSKLYTMNRYYNHNYKLHVHPQTHDWWIWYDPTPYNPLTVHPSGKTMHQSAPKRPPTPGSIHASDEDIAQHLNITVAKLNSYTWDYQLELRIKTGIQLRNERLAKAKLDEMLIPWHPPVGKPKDNDTQ